MRRPTRALASILLVAAMSVSPAPWAQTQFVYAGSGLNQYAWGGPGITLSISSYKYSNMSGFWQAVLNSQGCPVAVDGIFGSVTTWYTDSFQLALFGTHNAGVMTPTYLNMFQNAQSVYGSRLSYLFITDGYGTDHYTYYGGFDSPVRLGWNPYSSQWLFSQTPASLPTSLTPATPSRTIGSVPACA
jgi:hypothetical protein